MTQLEAAQAAQPPLRQPHRRPFKYRGVRKRSWGRWVAEIRVPKSSERLWLGSYASAHQAARAYDVAAACLRGPAAPLNLPMHAVPQPRGCLSPSSIRNLAAQEAAHFTFLDENQAAPPESSSAGAMSPSIMQHYSNNPPQLAPLGADEYNLQLSDQNVSSPQTELDYHLSWSTEMLDHSSGPTEPYLHTDFHSQAALPLSEPRDTHTQQHPPLSEQQGVHTQQPLHSEEARACHQSRNGPPSLLDLWFCLDIGPSVHPSLKALLAHSLYPDSGEL